MTGQILPLRPLAASEPGVPVGQLVHRDLRQRIIRGELAPGALLSEAEMARSFGSSRQPVREAFIKLAEEGLVEVRPQRGTLVRKISIKRVMDIRFVREAIEANVVHLLASEPEPAIIADLRAQIARQREVAPDAQDVFMALDETFHHTMARAIGKTYAWDVVESVKAQMDRVRYLSFADFPISRLIAQHEAIVDAIETRNPQAAEEAMRIHLREILKDLPNIAAARPELFDMEEVQVTP
ncbi:GntR family transcriptional regulator [Pannonibacter phragmitetus]|uniref:GntR family transcriptional regulator n=1 Tax=Pannonibacter phragmitetus TaxID=121719 RepID=A0A0U2WD58_9HYPH|nr:GntR family transcriptional regulator [Pannonibacter phragmitetus]ALV30362.1 GntR family transcriptional regulator [Pannonibacter phragmitetus]